MSGEAKKVCIRCGSECGAEAAFCPQDGSKLVPLDPGSDPLIGTVLLDQFEILQPIGSGGMGTVYKAIQTSVGPRVGDQGFASGTCRE